MCEGKFLMLKKIQLERKTLLSYLKKKLKYYRLVIDHALGH